MMKRTIKVFVDFDGTITLEDVGEAIFKKFGKTEKVKKIFKINDLKIVLSIVLNCKLLV